MDIWVDTQKWDMQNVNGYLGGYKQISDIYSYMDIWVDTQIREYEYICVAATCSGSDYIAAKVLVATSFDMYSTGRD